MKSFPIALLVLFLVTLPTFAQDNFEDIFDEGAFESTVQESEKQDEGNSLEYLFGNILLFDGKIVFPLNRQGYNAFSSFAGKFFVKATKPELGSLFSSFSYRQILTAGTNDSLYAQGYSFQNIDPTKIDFALSEFHLSFDAGKKVFFRIGTQLVSWGSTVFWSPSDFINLQKQEFGSGADLRQGKPGLRVHIPWEGGNFFLFGDLSKLVENKLVGDYLEQSAVGWRLDGVLSGWRLGSNGYVYAGGGGTPVLQLGLDLTTSLGGADIYSEVGTTVREKEVWPWQVAVGGSRTWGDRGEWSVTVEGLWNSQGRLDQDVPSFGSPDFGDFQSLYWGQWYGWAQVKRTKIWDDVLGISLAGVGNISDRSWKGTLQGDVRIPGFLPFSLTAGLTGGGDQREFTYQDQGPAVSFTLRSLLEF